MFCISSEIILEKLIRKSGAVEGGLPRWGRSRRILSAFKGIEKLADDDKVHNKFCGGSQCPQKLVVI
jgi:hypothetical protein